jgi:hypothetical protein
VHPPAVTAAQHAEITLAAAAKTSSSIAGVSRPVKVFCWLGW